MKFILSFCGLCAAVIMHGQTVTRVIYDFYHLKDTTNKSITYKEEMVLYAGEQANLYTSYTKMKQDSANARVFAEAQRTGNLHINLGTLQAYTEEQVYSGAQEQKITIVRPFNLNNYAITEDRPDMGWTILPDTATILGYACQKAAGRWKGRKYTAWFTTDLPYTAGPWKLQGLPGLILKAADEKNEVMFLCKSVSLYTPDAPPLFAPRNAISTTLKEFQRMVTAYRERQIAAAADSDFKVTLASSPGAQPRRTVFNNPIEIEK